MKVLNFLAANTRVRIALVLAAIWLITVVFNFSIQAFFMPIFSVLLVTFFDLLITYLRKKVWYFPASSFVTGFLIGLIISPNETPLAFILAAALSVFSKQFIRTGEHKHIFNPAAFGILSTSFILHPPISWWGVSWSPWIILVILSVSYTLLTLKRLLLPTTFLFAYSLYFFIAASQDFVLPQVIGGTIFLFAAVMLPEPITSPANGRLKYLFGPLLVALAIILGTKEGLPDVLLPALLLGNVVYYLTKLQKRVYTKDSS